MPNSFQVKAVDRVELRQYTDVIIFSTQGERSLASMLGGGKSRIHPRKYVTESIPLAGDYDGDTVYAIWHPEFTEKFKNADPSFADEPPEIQDAFVKNKETVGEFLNRAPLADPENHMKSALQFLLGTLKDVSVVGKYSNWHSIAVYTEGYRSAEAKRLAYM